MAPTQKTSIHFVTLGCPKNLVDSEVMSGILAQGSFVVDGSLTEADVGIVNTCGFIEDSKKESLNIIFELARQKKKGNLKLLIVAGCLSQRYKEELPKLVPEVDAFIGTGDFSRLPEIIRQKMNGEEEVNFIQAPAEQIKYDIPRAVSTPFYTRYVKVSEGCSHACSFCTIPMMRGGLRSRPVDDVCMEIERARAAGTKEFNLIAQDLNEYGRDLASRQSLYALLDKLSGLKGDLWLRLLYMYPLQFPDRLISLIKDHPHICPYVDIPLQHIDDRILKSMKRGSSARYIHRLIGKLRKEIPGIVLRTTFIVGYPSETDAEFGRLVEFVREAEFDRVGTFTFSQEEGTSSSLLKKQIPDRVKKERRDFLMGVQQGISLKKNKQLIGRTLKVLYEGPSDEHPAYDGTGRYAGQAPEIDGQILLSLKNNPSQNPRPGAFIPVKITDALEYDLIGHMEKDSFEC